MKISELWLREWVNPSITTQQLVAQLTMAGLEVDSVAPVAGEFNHVIVAKVRETRPHPQADKLTICTVDFGADAPLQIVCGASNVRAGLTVALAMIGATLPNGMTIKETKLRGELSQGMLCSASELGLMEQSEGIIELPEHAPLGQDLREYMVLNDMMFDLDLTPNRADCFSVLGIAREVATLNRLSLREHHQTNIQPSHDEILDVCLSEPHACPQYYGRAILDINLHATTPVWLLERLRRAGIRPIHPVVDVLNYVMIELGQPMHAFNRHAIAGDIQVRYSQKGEILTLLDEQKVTLNDKTLVIADRDKLLAIAGVMGGLDSAVQATTQDIFLESAFFNPKIIAGVARQYGLCTESSQRYERGVDPAIQLTALEYATHLIISIVGGRVGPVVCAKVSEELPARNSFSFSPALVQRLTGVTIPEEEMISTLNRLGIKTETHKLPWTVTAPSHRFDIELDVDIVEEIIRVYGYDKMTAQPMIATLQSATQHPLEYLTQRMGQFLQARGYHDMISYSFVDPVIQKALYPDSQTMTLLNPISSELSEMRVSLWPGLIASFVYNNHRQQSLIKLFEMGSVFDMTTGSLKEQPYIAGLMSGEWGTLNWTEPTRWLDFYDLKGDIQAMFEFLELGPVRFIQASHQVLHPGKSAQIYVGDKAIGWLGELHPRLVEALSLTEDVLLFELSLEHLVSKRVPKYKKISKFPSVRRDLSFLIHHDVTALEIENAIYEVVSSDTLKSFDVFDVYAGESIPAGKKSLAIALTLQDGSRTLIDEEINSVVDAIIKKLNQDFAITLRD